MSLLGASNTFSQTISGYTYTVTEYNSNCESGIGHFLSQMCRVFLNFEFLTLTLVYVLDKFEYGQQTRYCTSCNKDLSDSN